MPNVFPRRAQNAFYRYGLAVFITGAVLLVRLALDGVAATHSRSLLFSIALLTTAYLAGFGPTLLAAVLSSLTVSFIWGPPLPGAMAGVAFWVQIALFIAVAVVMNIFTEMLHRARERADASDLALRRLQDELQRHTAA